MTLLQINKISGPRLILLLILAAGAAIRFFRLTEESFWLDELYTVWVSHLSPADLAAEELAHGHMPAYAFLVRFWLLFGEGELWMRILPALLGLATVYLSYRLARELFSTVTALWASAFAAASPLLVWYSRDASRYSWLILVSLLYLYALACAARREAWPYWALCLGAGSLAVISNFYALFLFAGGAFVALLLPGLNRRRFQGWLLSHLALLALVAFVFVITPTVQARISQIIIPAAGSASMLFDNLAALPGLALWGFAGQEIGSGSIAIHSTRAERAVLLLAIAALVTAPVILRRKGYSLDRYRMITALFLYSLTIAAGPVAAQILRGFVISARNIAWAGPVLLIIIAALITSLPRRFRPVCGTIALALLLFFTVAEFSRPLNDDYRSAFATLNQERQEGDLLACFPISNCVAAEALYLPAGQPLAGGIIDAGSGDSVVYVSRQGEVWKGHRFSDDYYRYTAIRGEELRQWLAEEYAGYDRVWVFAGDGSLGNLPAADAVYEEMDRLGWREVERWQFSTLILTEFERAPIP